MCRLKLGEPDAAIADFDAALSINPKLASSLYGRGIARRKQGDADAAQADSTAAREIQPDIAKEFAPYGIE
ncbi:hypothetical protein H8A99_40340 [Bradyrhizobium sp. Arg68]|nr:hypothetical protein [Bradyrhizobium ivorense]